MSYESLITFQKINLLFNFEEILSNIEKILTVTLPVAPGFFADCLALGFGRSAVGHAVGLRADGHALGVVEVG